MARRKRKKKRGGLARKIALAVFLLSLAATLFCARHVLRGGELAALLESFPRIARPVPVDEATPPVSTPDARIQVFFGPSASGASSGIEAQLTALINRATSRIDGAFYELELESIARALIDRHRAGVRVRLVSDSDYEDEAGIRACIQAGIPVVFDERSALMHNKFCVVDGRYVWTGSTNITANGMYRNDNNALLLRSEPLAENFAAEFVEMFQGRSFGARSPENTPHPQLLFGGTAVECYFSPEDDPVDAILLVIEAASERIDFMAFSFTSRPIAEAMGARMKDGVAVRGVFEARNAGSTYSRDDYLRERGAEIHFDENPNTMHHKVIIVDAAHVITGSYNFSKSAERKNDENVLILHSETLAAAYLRELERLIPD